MFKLNKISLFLLIIAGSFCQQPCFVGLLLSTVQSINQFLGGLSSGTTARSTADSQLMKGETSWTDVSWGGNELWSLILLRSFDVCGQVTGKAVAQRQTLPSRKRYSIKQSCVRDYYDHYEW